MDMGEVLAGSPWGAGTLAAGDGSRQPSEIELKITKGHATHFTSIVTQYVKGA